MNKAEYLDKINKARLAAKGEWVNCTEQVNGVRVGIKSFNTWIQVMEVGERGAPNFVKDGGNCDGPVSGFKAFITQMLTHIPEVAP